MEITKIHVLFLFFTEFHGNTASDNRVDSPQSHTEGDGAGVSEAAIDKLKCNLMNQLNLIEDTDLGTNGLIEGTSGFIETKSKSDAIRL